MVRAVVPRHLGHRGSVRGIRQSPRGDRRRRPARAAGLSRFRGRREPRGRGSRPGRATSSSTETCGRRGRISPSVQSLGDGDDRRPALSLGPRGLERALRSDGGARGRALLDDLRGRERGALHGRQRRVEDTSYPGVYPFTRGVYPSMYRGKLWTMRQFAGFGTAEETNERFRYLLDHGQTGLSTAFDMPTLMGYDSDHERSVGEVGREGVAIDSLEDMETLFAGIPLGDVSTSMTINSPAAVLLAFYAVVGEEQGVPMSELRGTIQTDILKEYIAQKEYIFPPEPSMRLVTDMVEFCATAMPKWHPISISGYHIREAGLDGGAGARVHAGRRVHVRRVGDRARPGRRRVRAAALVLLQRAPRLLRGDREVPRGAADLGARAARPVRREVTAVVADAVPHADGRRLADRAAAGGEHRPHGARGAGGRARRHAVAAHELVRRGARAADGGGGADRAAHAAGDRARDGRRQHDRPARRLVLRRASDERARAAGVRVLRADRRAGRRRRRRSRRTSSSRRSPTRRSATRPRSRRSSGSSSASTGTSWRTSSRSRS